MTTDSTAVALDFVRDSKAVSGYVDSIDMMYKAALDHVRKLNARNGEAAATAFRNALRRELNPEVAALEQLLAAVYAQRFTVEELKAMQMFFRTPAGQKMIRFTSDIATDFAGRTAEFQQRMSTVIMPRIRDELLNLGFSA